MVPLLRMLESRGLSLSDAEAAGFHLLAQAAKRCLGCGERVACIRWLKWRGRCARTPLCPNGAYLEALRSRSQPASTSRWSASTSSCAKPR
jgi:hypothetical protein